VPWIDALAASARTPARYGVRVLKGAAAPLEAPVNNSKLAIDTHNMCVTAVLTTRTPDRQGDIVDPTGGDFSEHMTNPVVMFHHGKDHRLPIGKAEDPDGNYTVRLVKAADGDLLLGTTHFAQNNKFAQDVFGLVAEDILRGVSIGFDPHEDEDSVEKLGDSPVLDRPALHFKAWKLLEYSHTPIGVNRDALTVAYQKSLDGSCKLHPVLEKALQPWAKPRNTTVAVSKGDPRYRKDVLDEIEGVMDDAYAGAASFGKDIKKGAKKVASAVGSGARKVGRVAKKVAGKNLMGSSAVSQVMGVTKAMPAMPDDDYEDDENQESPDEAATDQGDGDEQQMPEDVDPGAGADFDPASDDPNDDPDLPKAAGYSPQGEEETPPTVQMLLDAGQGLMDLCSAVQEAVKKSEHMGGRKFTAKLCKELQQTAADCKMYAEKIQSELSGAGTAPDPGEADQDANADEDASEPREPPETDEDGAMVTKGGYSPRRFTFADALSAAPVAPVVPREMKGLQVKLDAALAENRDLANALKKVLIDVEAGKRRGR
jgi:hypothetical protein